MANITQQENQWLVSGDVLMYNASEILSQSNDFLMDHAIEIDFSAVTDVDTVALSLMMEWQRRAIIASGEVTFAHLPPNLVSLAALYGVTDFIPLKKVGE